MSPLEYYPTVLYIPCGETRLVSIVRKMSSGGRETSKYEFGYKLLLLCLWAFVACCSAEKYQYATLTECDRHSLDALYHEKFKIITNNVFKDTIELSQEYRIQYPTA
ncbi:hypothetical protein JTE90_022229 [Oedothorax gibbosus]|uniref:Uncharacterized protein n=1 Tax=Oedothorax gibbosus TaxID=931172 RepID=A0AAV6TR38_9ARAC|nr:hypothetical protein JTE90_022229 [Oedothorax gibbosus]